MAAASRSESLYDPSMTMAGYAALALGGAFGGFLLAYAVLRRSPRRGPERDGDAARLTVLADAATIFDVSLLSIVALDPDRMVMLWNPAAERMFGYSAADTIGGPYPLVPDTERAGFDAIFRRIEAGEMIRSMEVRRRRKDGTLVTVVFSGVPLRDRDGKFRGGLFMLDDVTQHRLMQQQLVQAQKMDAIGQLTGGIAHDFNNLLAAVIGNLDMAAEEVRDNTQAAAMIDDALNAALRGADLVKRLLAFARTQPMQARNVDLAATTADLAPLLRTSTGENITVAIACDDGLWPVRADPVLLQNALINLAINARDAMPDGGRLTIEAHNFDLDPSFVPAYPSLEPGEYVLLSVTDTGTGMPPDVAMRAFEPFFTTKEGGRGNGLGLSTVYGFMKQLGGGAKIYSEPGIGTTVSLYFPRAEEDGVAAAGAGAAQATLPRGNERVLVVEDNPDVAKAAIGMLEALGYSIVSAPNADAALVALAQQRFDLLFTDVVMPGRLNGIALAQEVGTRYPDMGILLTSGFSSKLNAERDLATLGADFLGKPYRRSDLAEAVRTALGKAEQRRNLAGV
jgi:PAS domain S-box-containing protein